MKPLLDIDGSKVSVSQEKAHQLLISIPNYTIHVNNVPDQVEDSAL